MGSFVPIGARLRDERERLGLSQSDLGAAAGVSRKTQFNYEADVRSPDAGYLAAVAGAGVDVRFVVTGARDIDPVKLLPSEEQLLIACYRKASPAVRGAALGALVGTAPSGAPRQVFHGQVGTAVAGDLKTLNMNTGKRPKG